MTLPLMIDRFCVRCRDPKFQRKESPAAPAFAPTNVEGRTESKGAGRELRNTAGCAIGGFRARRHPRSPDRLRPAKLQPVRRAHTSNRTSSCTRFQKLDSPVKAFSSGGSSRTQRESTLIGVRI